MLISFNKLGGRYRKTKASEGVWMDYDDEVMIIYIEDSHRLVECDCSGDALCGASWE